MIEKYGMKISQTHKVSVPSPFQDLAILTILRDAFDALFPSEHTLEKFLDRWETMP